MTVTVIYFNEELVKVRLPKNPITDLPAFKLRHSRTVDPYVGHRVLAGQATRDILYSRA